MANRTCSNCVYYLGSKGGRHGYCKIDPPVFTHIDGETGYARFNNPVVSPDSYCREHTTIDG